MNPFHRRIEHLEREIHPSESPDLDRLTPDEQRELDDILTNARPGGDLTALTDDELDRLRELQTVAWGH